MTDRPEDVVERARAVARIIDPAAFDWGETPWGPLSNLQTGHKQRWSRLGPAIADHRDEGKRRRERALTTAGEILATLPPPEDERVKGLVEALEAVLEANDACADTDDALDDYDVAIEAARAALASYRGGA